MRNFTIYGEISICVRAAYAWPVFGSRDVEQVERGGTCFLESIKIGGQGC